MRMVDRIHSHSPNVGPPPLPPLPARFPDRNVLVIGIADLPDRRLTGGQDLPHLAGLETELDVEPFPSHHLRRGPRTADQLPAPSGFELNVMHQGPGGICDSGSAFPTRTSASAPDCSRS